MVWWIVTQVKGKQRARLRLSAGRSRARGHLSRLCRPLGTLERPIVQDRRTAAFASLRGQVVEKTEEESDKVHDSEAPALVVRLGLSEMGVGLTGLLRGVEFAVG